MLEERLRAALRAAAEETPPPASALLEEMIRTARRVRRRRRVGYGAAGALTAISLVVFALTAPPGHQAPPVASGLAGGTSRTALALRSVPTPPPSPEPSHALPVDTVRSGELSTTDGHAVRLPDRFDIVTAYRVPLGWLAIGSSGDARPLWLVRPDGSMTELVGAFPGVLAVAPDGARVAWQVDVGGVIRTAVLTTAGLREERAAAVSPTTRLLGWFGDYVGFGDSGRVSTDNADQLDVRSVPDMSVTASTPVPVSPGGRGATASAGPAPAATGGAGRQELARVDVWDPSAPYRPTWAPNVRDIIGVAADRRMIALRNTGPRTCLVALDPSRRLSAGPTRCVDGVEASGRFTVSPDGEWIAARSDRTHLVIFSAGVVTGGHRPDPRPVVELPCVRDAAEVWVDGRTVLVPQPGGVLRYRIGSSEGMPVPLVETGAPVTLVPRFGA